MRVPLRVLLIWTVGTGALFDLGCHEQPAETVAVSSSAKDAPVELLNAPPVVKASPVAKTAQPKGQVVARIALNAETLVGLEAEAMTVNVDPFYKEKNPRFEGYPFEAVLARVPNIETIDRSRHSLRFVCSDGYRTTFPFKAVENGRGLLASALADHTQRTGKPWALQKRGKTEQTPAPYYLVWAGETDLKARPWPYQLVAIEVVANDALEASIKPPADANVDAGYTLFRTYCFACHTVNLQGGKMGPELNVPRNIFEYRDAAQLKAFVKNPQSFRAASLMPPQMLPDAQLDAIFAYLRAMAQRKVCSTGAECAARAAAL